LRGAIAAPGVRGMLRFYVMETGRVTLSGAGRELLADAQVQRSSLEL
jgi:ABC-type branched-subunit amino acid transport system ATPase component